MEISIASKKRQKTGVSEYAIFEKLMQVQIVTDFTFFEEG